MSNPKCGRCAKTVYLTERQDGGGKSWHKGCFRCKTCRSTLTLKTFKAHQGELYCNVHYPPDQTKVAQFGNDKKADSGTYETANAGGGDAGGYEQPQAGGYDQGGYDQGGYEQGGEQGGYDEGGYDQGY